MAAKGLARRLRDFLSPPRGTHRAGGETEEDVAAPEHQARTRATGGADRPDAEDQNSTTGTPANDTFVGRVSGEDVGYAGQTGAEAREQYEREGADTSGEDTNGRG
ncbi:MAG: hypothetical protein ACRDMV_13790 [Streptosporangiales bacterium]